MAVRVKKSSVSLILALLAILPACSGSKQSETDDTVQMKEQAVSDIEEEQVEHRRRATVDDEETPPPQDDDELVVEMFEVLPDKPARTESGLEIHMRSPGPSWAFEFDHHGRKTKVTYAGVPLYLEGHAYGHLYVISQLGDVVQVTLRADTEAAELTAEQAFEIARRERASRLGCDGTREETAVQNNGTAVLRVVDAQGAETCRIVVGRFTRQIVDL